MENRANPATEAVEHCGKLWVVETVLQQADCCA